MKRTVVKRNQPCKCEAYPFCEHAIAEHTKLEKVSAQSQACGDFLSWLIGVKGYLLARTHVHVNGCVSKGFNVCGYHRDELEPVEIQMTKLLAEYFNIDEAKLEREKQAMLANIRKDGR